jgi:hypothetical protein
MLCSAGDVYGWRSARLGLSEDRSGSFAMLVQPASPAMSSPTSLAPRTSSTTIMIIALCCDMKSLIDASGRAARSLANTKNSTGPATVSDPITTTGRGRLLPGDGDAKAFLGVDQVVVVVLAEIDLHPVDLAGEPAAGGGVVGSCRRPQVGVLRADKDPIT